MFIISLKNRFQKCFLNISDLKKDIKYVYNKVTKPSDEESNF